MPLSWTMDKVGPICRSAEDCALVFAVIHGADPLDPTSEDASFDWPASFEPRGLKIGYAARSGDQQKKNLKFLESLGFQLVEVQLPSSVPVRTLANLIDIEAACGFDQLLRERQTEGWNDWPDIFRAAQYVPAVEFVRMMRLRSQLMLDFEQFLSEIDFLFNVFDVFHTNLTGHPSIVVPAGFREGSSGSPRPITVSMTAHLNNDARLLALADLYQRSMASDHNSPDLDAWLEKYNQGELDAESQSPGESD
jgi:Asp-tRNA(Asn)/Glu-tRNA(Gln) amidotransferase A subunit family amidase